ncbi:MAG: hypothetical protein HY537_18225 [Deltaproteobacteria bacterium]|nr:hypothetical protein [Deltaproteobacteria bacterium]
MPNFSGQKTKTVRPDSKGRISLGKRAQDYSGYTLKESADGSILLEPLIEVPAREAWLFKNKEALSSVQKGLKQSAAGKTKSLGSFAKYIADDKKE